MIWFIAWVLCAIVGALIGMQTGKAGKGALLGFFFGPIGWVLMIYDVGVSTIMALCLGLLVVGIAVVSYLESREREDRRAEERAQAASKPQMPEPPAPQTPSVTSTEKETIYNADGTLKPLPAGTKTEKFWGHIVQHLEGEKLLMQTNHGRVVVQMPGELEVPDGSPMPEFDGKIIGTYRYGTTDGATRDVWHVLYIPPGLLPPKAAQVDHVAPSAADSIFPPGVDTPEQRRAYLQALAEEKKRKRDDRWRPPTGRIVGE